jgi:hypothetical protein
MSGKSKGVFDIISAEIDACLLKSKAFEAKPKAMMRMLPQAQLENMEAILGSQSVSYRDALVIQLAYWLKAGVTTDLTIRHPGGRAVAEQLGVYLAKHHVRSVKDAFQNIGKNTEQLARGNFRQFDDFLKWASGPTRSRAEIGAAFELACARIASTARTVRTMPAINRSALSFAAMARLVDKLLRERSQGAYEQFTVAALLHALLEQTRFPGLRVETKNLNASDKSSRAAGDIQILAGNRIVEAYEITANEWEEKLADAPKTIKDYDLARLNIVGDTSGFALSDILAKLEAQPLDIAVLNIQDFTRTLVAALDRPNRAIALERLYEFLDRYQPDVNKVNRYVELLEQGRLTED